jgi:hypothetical protein
MYRIIFGEIFQQETTSFDAEAMTSGSASSFSESSSTSSSSSSGSSKSSSAEPTKKKKKSEAAPIAPPVDSVERTKSAAEETMSDSDVVRKEDEEEEEDSKVPAIIQPGEVGTPRTRRSKKTRIDKINVATEFSPSELMAMELNPYPKILDTATTDTEYKCKEPPSIVETRQLLFEKYGEQDVDNTLYHVFGKSMCWFCNFELRYLVSHFVFCTVLV